MSTTIYVKWNFYLHSLAEGSDWSGGGRTAYNRRNAQNGGPTVSTPPTPTPPPATGSSGGTTFAKVLALVFGCGALLLTLAVVAFFLSPLRERFFPKKPGDPPIAVVQPLHIDAAPWGEVTRILDGEGNTLDLPLDPVTPLTMDLPPGQYTIDLRHPWSGEVGRCEVRIVENGPNRCQVQLVVTEAKDYFAEAGWGKGGSR
jgi:hypothetical protein